VLPSEVEIVPPAWEYKGPYDPIPVSGGTNVIQNTGNEGSPKPNNPANPHRPNDNPSNPPTTPTDPKPVSDPKPSDFDRLVDVISTLAKTNVSIPSSGEPVLVPNTSGGNNSTILILILLIAGGGYVYYKYKHKA
jgi:LPXTG-motif cell wall-anchored protein